MPTLGELYPLVLELAGDGDLASPPSPPPLPLFCFLTGLLGACLLGPFLYWPTYPWPWPGAPGVLAPLASVWVPLLFLAVLKLSTRRLSFPLALTRLLLFFTL